MKRPGKRPGPPAGRPAKGMRPARPAGAAPPSRPTSEPPPRAGGPPRGDARGSRPRHRAKDEETYHGLRACRELFARRPGDVVRVYVAEGRRRECAALLARCAAERLGYRVVPEENLARISGSTHHEGIAILARVHRRWTEGELLAAAPRAAGPLVFLDGVGNPHNFGAILRTCAHFGVAAVLGRRGELPPLSPAAVRVAEGGAEHVAACDLDDPVAALRRLREMGYAVVSTSSRDGEPPGPRGLAPRSVIVLGSEAEGVSPAIAATANRRVRIPGSGLVESLNVAVACGILLAAVRRGEPEA